MISQLRKKVAGPKNRTKWQQYDLDFTYICDHIVAMAFPASGIQKAYRNSINDVAKYLEQKHMNNYMIVNVSNRDYDYQIFKNKVKQYSWNDHQAPTLDTLFEICYDVYNFLRQSKTTIKSQKQTSLNALKLQSIVCFHCNHGKGRTGTAIIAFILYTGFFKESQQARKFYNKRRFSDANYGVDQPCQLRYLKYFEQILCKMRLMLQKNIEIQKPLILQCFPLKTYYVERIVHKGFNNDYYINIYQTRGQVIKYSNINLHKQKQQSETLIKSQIPIIGDVYIEIWKKKWNSGKKTVVRANINMFFLQNLSQNDIKEGSKSKRKYYMMTNKNVKISSSLQNQFQVTFIFKEYCDCYSKINLQCLCHQQRKKQYKYWSQMLQTAQFGASIHVSQACKLLYRSHEICSEQNLQEQLGRIKSL